MKNKEIDPVVVGWILEDGQNIILSRTDIPQVCNTTLNEYTRVLHNAERLIGLTGRSCAAAGRSLRSNRRSHKANFTIKTDAGNQVEVERLEDIMPEVFRLSPVAGKVTYNKTGKGVWVEVGKNFDAYIKPIGTVTLKELYSYFGFSTLGVE